MLVVVVVSAFVIVKLTGGDELALKLASPGYAPAIVYAPGVKYSPTAKTLPSLFRAYGSPAMFVVVPFSVWVKLIFPVGKPIPDFPETAALMYTMSCPY